MFLCAPSALSSRTQSPSRARPVPKHTTHSTRVSSSAFCAREIETPQGQNKTMGEYCGCVRDTLSMCAVDSWRDGWKECVFSHAPSSHCEQQSAAVQTVRHARVAGCKHPFPIYSTTMTCSAAKELSASVYLASRGNTSPHSAIAYSMRVRQTQKQCCKGSRLRDAGARLFVPYVRTSSSVARPHNQARQDGSEHHSSRTGPWRVVRTLLRPLPSHHVRMTLANTIM